MSYLMTNCKTQKIVHYGEPAVLVMNFPQLTSCLRFRQNLRLGGIQQL